MRGWICFFITIGFIFGEGSFAFAEDVQPLVLTLDECVELALERNPKSNAMSYDVDAARAQLMEADALFWPVLEYRYRGAPVPKDVDRAINSFFDGQITFFNTLNLGIGAPIATFGQIQTLKRMAEGGIEAAKQNEVKEKSDTILQVKQLYYGMQFASEIQHLLSGARDELNGKIDDEEVKELPDINPIDLLKLKALSVELERRLAETEENARLAAEGMRIQLDFPPDASLALKDYHLEPIPVALSTLDKYVEASMANRPDAKLVEIGVLTKQRQHTLEKRKLMPKAIVGAFFEIGGTTSAVQGLQATDDFNDPFNFKRAGVGLQIEGRFDFHGAAARIKKTRAEYMKALLQSRIAKRGLSLETQKNFLQVKRLAENVRRAKRSESLARQQLFLAKSNIDVGIGETSEFGEALKSLLLARAEYFKTVFDYNIGLAQLEKVVGSGPYAEITPPMTGEDPFVLDLGMDVEAPKGGSFEAE